MNGTMTDRIDNARDKTGDVLTHAGDRLRRGSKTAAKYLEKGGTRTADVLETSGAKVSKHNHRGMRGYIGSHPARFLLIGALIGAFIAVMLVRGRAMSGDDDDDWDD